MSDIVERLKRWTGERREYGEISDVCRDAAARIERLEKALRVLGDHWKHGYGDNTRGGVIAAVEKIANAALEDK